MADEEQGRLNTPEAEEEIPLFPLNVVLFPGMVQPLHIYEERYKQMVHHCLETTTPFGIVWARPSVGEQVHGVSAIGTSAAIVHVEPLRDGRMNILAVGRSRFRLLAVFGDKPYLVGRVRAFPMSVRQALRAEALERRVREHFGAYAATLHEATGLELEMAEWPEGTAAAAVLAAIALQVPLGDKQRLLAQPTVDDILAAEIALFRREQVVLQHMAAMMSDAERLDEITTGAFSHN
ncbi:MAG: hypothetical protein GX605_12520 [Chloroflexi bacterium]|nr:hypothetical protein [Chloroflexota bacterium]